MTDLRSFLGEIDNAVFRPAGELSVVEEITAVQHALFEKSAQPVVMIERPRLPDGSISETPVLCNLTASRELCAKALGIEDHRDSAQAFAARTTASVEPLVVAPSDAPVRDVVMQGDDADLFSIPTLKQHGGDAGRYLTAGHAVTYDPDSGIDNMSIQRCWVREKRLLGTYPFLTGHNWRNIEKFWNRGEPAPIALWIGHHPAVVMGTQAKIGYPQSHWSAAGGAIGQPLRIVPSVTHGDAIMVPADAEIVVEGYMPPNRLEAEGPFAEYTGYQGSQVANPVIEVTCITRRRDAIYQDCGSGLADHLVPDNMAMEGTIYTRVVQAAPSLVNVHVPFSGRRFHAYLQFDGPRLGEVRDALMAAISYNRLKAVVAVDTDIDMFDDRQMMWAIATRLQWHRDFVTVDGLSEANLDPSTPRGAKSSTKAALDATLPPAAAPGLPRPMAPANRVGAAALSVGRNTLAGVDTSGWPGN